MATLKDVAKLANVDVSTVSRALNNTSYVHPDTKARIYEAAKTLSYHPNVMAKALREGKRHTIAVVVPSLQLTIFAEIIQVIEQAAWQYNYATLICNTEDDRDIERECLTRLRNGFVDGIIIATTGKNNRLLKDINASGIPVTQIVRQQSTSLSSVIANYDKCGYDATKFLIQQGCKQIGLINGSSDLHTYRDRYQGYQRALKEFDLQETSTLSATPTNSFDYGYQGTLDLLEQNPHLDGIIASVDVQAIGALRALKEQHRRVPEQVRVISLTGHSISGFLETAISCMTIPAGEIGKNAVRINIEAIEQLRKNEPVPAQHLIFSPVLEERDS